MTITIDLLPEEETLLREQAQQRGKALEDEAYSLVRAGLKASSKPASFEEGHARLIQRLLDAGLLTELPTQPGLTVPFHPITVLGPPVSQTLLEDRE